MAVSSEGQSAGSLAGVLATQELAQRPSRTPDFAAENRALVSLATALAENPSGILQRVVDTARELCGADSAGVSIVESKGPSSQIRWHAVAGAWASHAGSLHPRRDSPCDAVLEGDSCLLMRQPGSHFAAFRAIEPPAWEALLAPFHDGSRPAGAVWVVTHRRDRRFNREDARLLGTMARFASAACFTTERLKIEQGLRQERLAALNLMEDAIAARGEMERVTAALRASEEQFRRAIEDAPIPIIMHAEDGQVLQISRTWTELTGYTQEDIPTFDAWLNRAYGFGADSVRDRMQAIFEGKQARQQFELQITTLTGEKRDWVFTISAPGRLADGRRFAVGMVNDMTERTRAERGLRESEERLREADRRKNHFLAMLGHELRNPLAAIRGGLSLLSSEKTLASTREKTLPIVAAQVAHMERLVDDLLDLTRIVEGRVQLRTERVTIQDVLRNAIPMLQTQIEAGGFDVQLRLPPEPLTVQGDPIRLNQVVVNVLGNAMKYSGDARRIDVSVSSTPGAVAISVRDHGQGIPAELLPHIFEPFMQARPAITIQEGLGLGLTVVRQLAELHGGRVEAFSEGEGKGSEFVLHLPLAAATP